MPRKPTEWTIWQAVEEFNDPSVLEAYERARSDPEDRRFARGTPRYDLQMRLNGTVETMLRYGKLRAVGRFRDPLAPLDEIPSAAWVEYVFGSYADSFATRKTDRFDRIYEIRIAKAEDRDALIAKYVTGSLARVEAVAAPQSRGGTPGNPHWEEVFDALLTPLIKPAEFENQQRLIEAIEETFEKLGYEAPTQDGIRKRLAAKWPRLRDLARRGD